MAALNLPSLVLLQFLTDRARIERELCVQRELVGDMRTCHGECQLSKRLAALESEAEKGFPADRTEVRFEPVVTALSEAPALLRVPASMAWPPLIEAPRSGHPVAIDHVPWG